MASINGILNTLTSIKSLFRNRIRLGLAGYSQLFFYSFLFSYPSFSYAGPTDGIVVGGNGHIHYNGNATDIHQISSRLAIDWASYNVGANETVNYQQLTTDIALNRILSTGGSDILGRINAQGTVVLVNPNGIFFGGGSQVNVGGLIASGLAISSTDFLNGNYAFKALEGTSGLIEIENGSILKASLGGAITLLGRQVINNGLISANLGTVNLAAGNEAVLTFDNAGLIGVKVTKEILQNELGVDAAIINNGVIEAQSGRILLTASQSQDVFSQAVNSNGIEQATSVVVNADGSFTLGGGADVVNTGTLSSSSLNDDSSAGQIVVLGENITSSGVIEVNARNQSAGQIELHSNDTTQLTQNSQTTALAENAGQGGDIKVLGNKVGLFDNSTVDASGANGGGEVLIGGDQQGLNKNIRNAEFIYLGENTQVKTDALIEGNGGKLITFAADTARIHGDLYSRGGVLSGNGGFIETSGLKGFKITKTPDISAVNGTNGAWLIDPNNIDIVAPNNGNNPDVNVNINNSNPFVSTNDGAQLSSNLIEDALVNDASVTITTASAGTNAELGNISITDNIDYSDNGTASLTFNANNSILITNSNIRSRNGGALNLTLNANANGSITGTGNVVITDAIIETDGGTFNASGVDFTSSRSNGNGNNIIDTNGGNVTLTMTGAIDINAEIVTNGGSFTVASSASFTNNNANGDIDTSATDGGAISITSAGNVDLGKLDVRGAFSGGSAGLITVTSGNDITLSQQFDFDRNYNNTLTFNAANDININALISDTGAGPRDTLDVIFNANSDAVNTGSVNINSDVYTGGGNFTATGVVFDSTNSVVNTDFSEAGGDSTSTTGGDVQLTMTGAVTLGTIITEKENNTNGSLTIIANGVVTDASGLLDINSLTTITAGAANDVILNNTSNNFRDNVRIVSARDATLYDTTGISLGDVAGVSTISRNFTVTSDDNMVDNGVLNVTGISTFTTNTSNRDIILDNNNILQGTINVSTAGDGSGNITLNNSFTGTTTLGDVTANGALTVNAQADLTLTGALISSNTSGNNLITSDITFGLDNAAGRIFTINNTASISLNAGTGESVELNVNGNNFGSTFNFDAGSSVSTAGLGIKSVIINGGTGADTFNINASVLGRITAGAGNDVFNIGSNLVSVNDLRGDAGVDTLNGSDNANAWSISSLNRGAVNTVSFRTVENLVGGTGIDTLTGPDGTVTWDIGAGTGNLAQAGSNLLTNDFTEFENYTGGSGNDTFVIRTGGTFGVIDGANESVQDILDTSNLLNNTLTLGTNFINIEQVIGNNTTSTLVGTNAGQNWDIIGINDGIVDGIEFVDFFNITGGGGDDTFLFQPAGDILGVIDAGAGTDTVDYSNLGVVDISLDNSLGNAFNGVVNAETIRGNNTNSTLTGNVLDNNWLITGNNDGQVTDTNGTVNFENFNFLVGNGADDDFLFQSTGVITGSISGGGSATIDTLNMAAVDNVNVTLGVNVIGIEQITGNNINSTLAIVNGANTWNITGANDGNVAGVDFINFNNLTGGMGNDDFVYGVGSSLSGLIDGGNAAATDTINGSLLAAFDITLGTGFTNIDVITGNNTNSTLTGLDAGGTWNISGENDGSVAGITFVDFNNLTGGTTGNDDFIFATGSSVTGLIDGGVGATDTVDGSALANFDIVLGTGFINIETFIGGGANGTFRVASGDNTWTISGVNSGNVNGVIFNGFANLTGGTGIDDFVYTSSGSISGLINGAGNADTLNGSALNNFDVTIGTGIVNIEQVTGNDTTSSLFSLASTNTWNVTGQNDGRIQGVIDFIDFVNLTGGDFNDTFVLAAGASISGAIDGGNGTGFDIVNGSALSNFTVTLNTNMGNIERFIGNNIDSTFNVVDGTNTWNISGANDGNVAGVEFVNFFNLTGGTGNDDFIFATGSSIDGLIDGGNAAAIDTINGSALGVFNITLGAANIGFINIDQVIGNNLNSTLASASTDSSTWNINATNGGTLADISFTGFTDLVGGAGDDTFTFFDGGSISGTIAGGAEATSDKFNYSNLTTPLNISLSSFFTNTSGIEQIIGNNAATSSLIGQQGLTNWNITSTNDGNYINGTDTVLFFNFNNLTGNTGNDNFVLTGGGAINGLIDGGTGTDTYDASALTGAVVVAIDEDVIRVENILGNNNVNSTLIASNATNNQWDIIDANDGVINTNINFFDFNNITGGVLNDTFIFNNVSASLGGVLDGGSGTGVDVVFFNLPNFVLDLGNPTTTITNIEFVLGNNVDGTIIGDNIDNVWSITNENDGSITNANSTITYINFTNIIGGDFNDDFIFTSNGIVRGQIDGGSGVNTIDYSALATVSVNVNPVDANGIININTIIGNDINSTINATVNPNTWSVTGNNDGRVNGINFTNFNVLNGSDAVDIFNIGVAGSLGNQVSPDTDFTSGIYGLGGDDIFNVTLDGTNNGSIKINGGRDNDSLVLNGGALNYNETYESNAPGGFERFSYVQDTNTMRINFLTTETITDDVIVSQLTVNGTTNDNVLVLNAAGGNNFQLGLNSLIDYTGKESVTINMLGGTNDVIDIQGDINLTGTLTLNSETVTNINSSLISADTLFLNSVVNGGVLGAEIRTDVANLRLAGITGDVFIEEASSINIGEMNTSGLFELRALTGNITDSGDLVSSGVVNLFADNGNIILDNNNRLSGELSLDAQLGNITLTNGTTQLNTITTQNLTIAANGDITDVATAVITTTGSTTLSALGQNIVLDSATSIYTDITVTDTANLTLLDSSAAGLIISNVAVGNSANITSNGNLNINTVSAGNTASLTTTGAILDSNDAETNVTASLLQISAVTGIGEADSFETQVRTMDVVNTGSGVIDLTQTGVIDLVALQNLGTSGDITFESDADINLNQNSVVANQNGTGVLFMTTQRGSYLGLGEADVTNPDITARNATFFGLAGTFGTFQRPITLDVPQDGSVLIATRASFDPQFAPPRPDDVVTQGIDFSALGAISAAAGEQLVAVESLGDIDPAIFTDLQNYSVEETAIRMPRDQLFEDELDERERF